ncbi:MAG: T9SS C-terminal target domain-containing protein, partial [Gemmatimonadetes bacterium]
YVDLGGAPDRNGCIYAEAQGREVCISDGEGEGTITNDDTAQISINDTTVTEGDSGTTTMTFTVTLNAAVDVPVTVYYETMDSTATAGAVRSPAGGDYNYATGSVTFPANSTTNQTINVTVVGDETVEDDEVFHLWLATEMAERSLRASKGNVTARRGTLRDVDEFAQGRSVTLGDSLGRGVILNDDTIWVTINDDTKDEEDAGDETLDFTVTLSASPPEDVTLWIATANGTSAVGNATANLDYEPIESQQITFPANGGTTQTFNITFMNDIIVELNEWFSVNLTGIQYGGETDYSRAAFQDSVGIGTIVDSDTTTIWIGDRVRPEGNPGDDNYIDFTLRISHPVDEDLTIALTTSDLEALDGIDYEGVTAAELTFPGTGLDADRYQSFNVAIIEDDLVEDNEQFQIDIGNVLFAGQSLGSRLKEERTSARGTIQNQVEDVATVTISGLTQAEGNSDSTAFNLTLRIDREIADSVSVPVLTVDQNSATPGVDYRRVQREYVTFYPQGSDTQTITVYVYGDELVETDEYFDVALGSPALFGGTPTYNIVELDETPARVTITNDDVAQVSISDAEIAEGNNGTTALVFTLTQSATVESDVTVVANTQAGTATPNVDYTPLTDQTVRFTPGNPTQTLTVLLAGDMTVELDETFTVELSDVQIGGQPNANQVSILDGQGVGTILNDDAATVSINSVSGAEASGSLTFTVTLSQAVDVQTRVVANTADGTAEAGTDYTAVTSRNVIFTPGGALSQSVAVPLIDDNVGEDNETFTVTLSDLEASNRSVTISGATGTGTIVNDDAPDAGPEAENDAYTADEDVLLSVAAPGVLSNDSDDNGDVLTAQLVSDVSHGTLTLNDDGSFTYQGDTNFFGTDSFTYQAFDGTHLSATATVTLTVTAVNDVPEWAMTLSDTTFEEDSSISFDLKPYVTDVESDVGDFSWSVIASVASRTGGGGVVELSAAKSGGSAHQKVEVMAEKRLQVAVQPVAEREAVRRGNLRVDDFTASVSSDGILTLTAANDWFGTRQVTVTATDEGGASITDSFLATVTNVNDAPVLGTLPADVSLLLENNLNTTVQLSASDPDRETLTFSAAVVSGTLDDQLVSVNGSTLTLNPYAVGDATVEVTVEDPQGSRDSGTFLVTVDYVTLRIANRYTTSHNVDEGVVNVCFTVSVEEAGATLYNVDIADSPISMSYAVSSSETVTLDGYATLSVPAEFTGSADLCATFDLGDSRLPDPAVVTLNGDFTLSASNIAPGSGQSSLRIHVLDNGAQEIYEVPDLNGDGCVEAIDLQILIYAYGSVQGDVNYNPLADIGITGVPGAIGQDGRVDFYDLALFAEYYGTCNGQPIGRPSDRHLDAVATRETAQLSLVEQLDSDHLRVKVLASPLAEVYAHHLVLNYPADVLEVVSVEAGDFLSSGGIETFFYPLVDAENGKLTLDGSCLGAVDGMTGSGTLAEIVFAIKQSGHYTLDWSSVTLLNRDFQVQDAISLASLSGDVVKAAPEISVPVNYALHQNYPNPFNPKTTLRFDVPQTARVSLSIYDVSGALVRTLVDGEVEAGYHQVVWDGTDASGQAVKSGVYVYRLDAGSFSQTESMVLLR